mmetsp:Transcript_70645/g.147998  ORF Transcript_70645/g.147998 Transcript_70645/m.147998 type:complete len:145 (+) Transcript_70645:50-484(+)
MGDDAAENLRYVRTQVAKWKATSTDVEALLDQCMQADERLGDLTRRCKGNEVTEKSDLESGQEAFVRSRMQMAAAAAATSAARQANGNANSNAAVLKRSRGERKKELQELREELATMAQPDESDTDLSPRSQYNDLGSTARSRN